MLRWWIRLQHVLLLRWSTFCWSAVILSFCAFWECVGSQLAAIKGCAPGPVRAIPECIASRCVTTWLTLVVLPSSSFPLIRLQCGEICQSDTRMRTHTYPHAHTQAVFTKELLPVGRPRVSPPCTSPPNPLHLKPEGVWSSLLLSSALSGLNVAFLRLNCDSFHCRFHWNLTSSQQT